MTDTVEESTSIVVPDEVQHVPAVQEVKETSIMVSHIVDQWTVASKISSAMFRAGMVPSSYEKRGEAAEDTKSRMCIGILKGFEIGLQPVTALSTIAVINNRPCLWGDGAKALIQRSGLLEWYKEELEGEGDDQVAVVKMKRRGQDEPYVGKFSVADAKRAGLWANASKQPWVKYPQRMLKWRAFSFASRDGFADILSGLSVAEEIGDLPDVEKETAEVNTLLAYGE